MSENIGFFAMLRKLNGNHGNVEAVQTDLNKKIESVALDDDTLVFKFSDGYKLTMFDAGQDCCEHRYMTTDDDLSYFGGADLLNIEIKDGPTIYDCGEEHEQQFLEITTSKGVFTMVTHNEHNGYYGGFCIVANGEPPKEATNESR